VNGLAAPVLSGLPTLREGVGGTRAVSGVEQAAARSVAHNAKQAACSGCRAGAVDRGTREISGVRGEEQPEINWRFRRNDRAILLLAACHDFVSFRPTDDAPPSSPRDEAS